MTLTQAYNGFQRRCKLMELSEKTIYNYKQFIGMFLDHVGSDTNIDNINKDIVCDYVESLGERDISKATKATYLRHLRTFLKWVETEYNKHFELDRIPIPKTPKKVLHIYTDEEIYQIFNSVTAENEWIVARNRSMIALMLDSGLRQKEVCTLKRADVNMNTRILKVNGKGNKERFVPLGEVSAHFLKNYLRLCPYDSELVFIGRRGMPVTCDSVKHFMYRLGAKLPFEFSSHKLRHNFATNYCLDQYEKHGQVDIYRLMVLMGHEEIETTKRYLHFANQILASKTNISHLDKVLNM